MKPIVFALTITCAGVTGVSVAAQKPSPQPAQPAHKVFTLNGCLTANPGATDAFKLTGAVPVGIAPPEDPAPGAEAKGVYVLLPTTGLTEQGVPRAEMQTHVGRRVEVTVRPIEAAPGPSTSSSVSKSTSSDRIEEPAPQRYTVTKITSVAGSCPGA
jgi:hypothetical protein